METQTLSFTQTVKAAPAEVYRAFTNATALREWLCDAAMAVPHPGGRLYLWWNSGYYTSGEYTSAQPGEQVAFTWHGRGEPGPTRVRVTFAPKEGATLLTLEHMDLGKGEDWTKAFNEIEEGWKIGLENLASIFDTGEDLRFVRRPMLGITIADFDQQIAARLGAPVNEGIRLDGVVEGMGAQAAGLQNNDVIVSLAGYPVTDWASLTNALQKHHAGDEIEVVFYRGPEKKRVRMQLSRRPIPEIPWSAAGLAQAVGELETQMEAALDGVLQGVTEEEASYRPSESEWNIKEILAHLIHSERGLQTWIAELITGQERFSDDFGGNLTSQVEATVAAFPTLRELREELRRNRKENLELYARLPADFVARKSSYWRLAFNVLQPDTHLSAHLEQMRAALQAARAAGGISAT